MKPGKKRETTVETSCTPGTAWMKTVVLVRWQQGSRLTQVRKEPRGSEDPEEDVET